MNSLEGQFLGLELGFFLLEKQSSKVRISVNGITKINEPR
jgi:hypothetical protein